MVHSKIKRAVVNLSYRQQCNKRRLYIERSYYTYHKYYCTITHTNELSTAKLP